MPYTIFFRIHYAVDGVPGVQDFRGTNEERTDAMDAWMKSMREQHGAAFAYGMAFAFADEWRPTLEETE